MHRPSHGRNMDGMVFQPEMNRFPGNGDLSQTPTTRSQQPTPPLSTQPSSDERSLAVEDDIGRAGTISAATKLLTPPSSPPHENPSIAHFENHPLLAPDHAVRDLPDLISGIRSFLQFSSLNPLVTNRLIVSNLDDHLYQSAIDKLLSTIKHLRYEYDWFDKKFTIMPPPSAVHESPQTFLSTIHATISHSLRQLVPNLWLLDGGSKMYLLKNELGRTRDKCPDRAFQLLCRRLGPIDFPCFVVEVAYSETYSDAVQDACHWLGETLGHVRAVVLIKFSKPLPRYFSDIKKWKGVIEVWEPS